MTRCIRVGVRCGLAKAVTQAQLGTDERPTCEITFCWECPSYSRCSWQNFRSQSLRQRFEKTQTTKIVYRDDSALTQKWCSLVIPSEVVVGQSATPRRSTANPSMKTPTVGAVATIYLIAPVGTSMFF